MGQMRKKPGPMGRTLHNICWAWLLTSGLLFLVLGNRPTVVYVLGFSGTFWTVILTLLIAVTAITLVISSSGKSILSSPSWRPAFLSVGAILLGHLGFSLFRGSSWDGYQMVGSLLAFILVLTAMSVPNPYGGSFRLSRRMILVLLSLAAVIILAAHLSGADFEFTSRARGQTFALGAAVIPLLTRSGVVGTSVFIVLGAGAVLSDSRFASATIAVLAGFLVMALWRNKRLSSRIFAGTLAIFVSGFLIGVLQALAGLRASFDLPIFTLLASSQALGEQALVEQAPAQSTSFKEEFRDVNRWSNGRLEFATLLLGRMNSVSDWAFGKGSGFASSQIQSVYGIEHPHNEYVRFLVDGGITGLFLLLALGFTLFLALLQSRSRIGQQRFWAGMALLFLLASHSFFTNSLIFPYFFVPVAVFFGIAVSDTRPLGTGPITNSRTSRVSSEPVS